MIVSELIVQQCLGWRENRKMDFYHNTTTKSHFSGSVVSEKKRKKTLSIMNKTMRESCHLQSKQAALSCTAHA